MAEKTVMVEYTFGQQVPVGESETLQSIGTESALQYHLQDILQWWTV